MLVNMCDNLRLEVHDSALAGSFSLTGRRDSPSIKRRLNEVDIDDVLMSLQQELEGIRQSNQTLHAKLDDAREDIRRLSHAQEVSSKKLTQLSHVKANVSMSRRFHFFRREMFLEFSTVSRAGSTSCRGE